MGVRPRIHFWIQGRQVSSVMSRVSADHLVIQDRFQHFAAAAAWARQLAREFQTPTEIHREEADWCVYVSPFIQSVCKEYGLGCLELGTEEFELFFSFANASDPATVEIQRELDETKEHLLDQMASDMAAWGRLKATGWFYDDDG